MTVEKEATETTSFPVTPLDTETPKPSSGREDKKSANGEQPVWEQQGDDRWKKNPVIWELLVVGAENPPRLSPPRSHMSHGLSCLDCLED